MFPLSGAPHRAARPFQKLVVEQGAAALQSIRYSRLSQVKPVGGPAHMRFIEKGIQYDEKIEIERT